MITTISAATDTGSDEPSRRSSPRVDYLSTVNQIDALIILINCLICPILYCFIALGQINLYNYLLMVQLKPPGILAQMQGYSDLRHQLLLSCFKRVVKELSYSSTQYIQISTYMKPMFVSFLLNIMYHSKH